VLGRRLGRSQASERGLVWVLPAALGQGAMTEGVGWEEVATELRSFLGAPFAVS